MLGDNQQEEWNDFDAEIVIGLVGAVGTELRRVADVLGHQLRRAGYDVEKVQVSEDVIPLLQQVETAVNDPCQRINSLMTAGNEARKCAKDNSVLALGVASLISSRRTKNRGNYPEPRAKFAVIVNSLKRPEEVERLRSTYPGGFVLIGIYADEEQRLQHLTKHLGIEPEAALELIKRDSKEETEPYGQRLTQSFYLADFFVRPAGNEEKLWGDLRRIVELLFGYPFATPSFDEYAMYLAFAAALRSADLSRQVGAVIAKDHQILATGANDCPKCRGGLYWPVENEHGCLIDEKNGRDYKRGFDSNNREQEEIIDKIVDIAGENLDETTLRKVLSDKKSPIRQLTEYGRVVHAEMEALLSIARSTNSASGATLYCTTFPCHNCAKHIVAAGILRVVYIEPYEKSRAPKFHDDSVIFGFDDDQQGKVQFQPFLGVGPRKFFDLFSMNLSSGYDLIRKEPNGSCVEWDLKKARLRLRMWPRTYLDHEIEASNKFKDLLPHQGGTNGSSPAD